jgi:F-type H+-transporting ATPase subunit epsilon
MDPLVKTMPFEALTPYAPAWRTEAAGVVFSAPDGEVGILPGRSALVAVLARGELRVTTKDGDRKRFYVSEGFMHVHEGGVTLLTEEMLPIGQIDAEAAWEELTKARQMPSFTDEELARRDRAVDAARRKFALAQEARKTDGKP